MIDQGKNCNLILFRPLGNTLNNEEANGSVNGMDFSSKEVLRNNKGKIIQRKIEGVGGENNSNLSVESYDEENFIMRN